ncbi:MAG: ABC transporter ATP-binding protein [Halodesulfurarchaeum sp.]
MSEEIAERRDHSDSPANAASSDGEETATTLDPAETILCVEDVSKAYGPEKAVEDLSFSVRDGELLTLLGPSGCGKTTTLRLLAGLEEPGTGEITIDGDVVANAERSLPPEERSVGMVFQDFALFPHLSVRENVAFGLEDAPAAVAEDRVEALLDLVDLEDFGDRSPDQLSGGQKQRVALARALAPEPDILLLDEPFSNLDVRLRVEMREEVRRILKEAGVTAISVTHDQEEALSISDRVAVMHEGRVEQVGDPSTVFQQPRTRFVASFLGQAGFLSARVDGGVETGLGEFDREVLNGGSPAESGARIDLLVRPDDVAIEAPTAGSGNGTIIGRQYTGPSFVYHVELDNGDELPCLLDHDDRYPVGERVDVQLVSEHSLAWFQRERETA